MKEVENAVITSLRWDRERGLTHNITVEGSGWGCTLGGYRIDGYGASKWINAFMDVIDCYEFSDKTAIGKNVRVETENGVVVGIGHIFKDKWLRPKELFEDSK